MELETAKAELLQQIKVTKGCRFNASDRLRRRDRRMVTITAFASVYVILLTMLPLLFRLGTTMVNIITTVIIIFSLIILASSLLQYSNNDPVRAEQHHRCGLELNRLRRELRFMEPITVDSLQGFVRQYDEVIQKYAINHELIDFERYKLEHPEEYPRDQSDQERSNIRREIKGVEEFASRVVGGMSIAAIIAAVASFLASVSSDKILGWIHQIFHQ